jgi:hypothetical protein
MFYESMQMPFLEPLFAWFCQCSDACQVVTPATPPFTFEAALYNPDFYLLLALSLLVGLSLTSFILNFSLFSLSKSAPGGSSLAVFNVLLFRLKPNFLALQSVAAFTLFACTCVSLDLYTLNQLYDVLSQAYETQQVMFPQAQIILSAIVLISSVVSHALFHTMLCSALHLIKTRGSDYKPRALLFSVMCDSLNLITLACCVVQVLYLSFQIKLV